MVLWMAGWLEGWVDGRKDVWVGGWVDRLKEQILLENDTFSGIGSTGCREPSGPRQVVRQTIL